jgi:acetyl-CoA synthetase
VGPRDGQRPRHRWFVGGRLNITANALDRHAAGASDALADHVRRELGPIATPAGVEFVAALPRTRSGKVLRRCLKARELGADAGDLSTLDA